jgi:hypothetical protein
MTVLDADWHVIQTVRGRGRGSGVSGRGSKDRQS